MCSSFAGIHGKSDMPAGRHELNDPFVIGES
jgi:hypothetical protein